jgi:hypothetical protein
MELSASSTEVDVLSFFGAPPRIRLFPTRNPANRRSEIAISVPHVREQTQREKCLSISPGDCSLIIFTPESIERKGAFVQSRWRLQLSFPNTGMESNHGRYKEAGLFLYR